MVIISTSAVEVNIHALSPLSTFAAGAGEEGVDATEGASGVTAGAPVAGAGIAGWVDS